MQHNHALASGTTTGTIASGGSLSDAINLDTAKRFTLCSPAGWTAHAAVTIIVSYDGCLQCWHGGRLVSVAWAKS